MPFSPDEGAFMGFVVEAIVYGMYVIIFSLALNVLLGHPRGKAIDPLLTFATCLLFACCTAHFALNFDNKWKGLITEPGVVSISDETKELFADDIIVSITDFFGQLVLIYRCWLMWSQNYWVVAFPILLALTALSCAMAGLGILAETDPNAPIAPPAIVPLGTTSFALSLCLNIIVTALIVGRIWYLSRLTQNLQSESTKNRIRVAVGVMVESGVLYLAVQLVFVVLFSIRHPAQDVVVPLALQVYGIAPTLMIVRVRMGSSYEETTLIRSSLDLTGSRPAAVSVRMERRRQPANELELMSFASSEEGKDSGPGAARIDKYGVVRIGPTY